MKTRDNDLNGHNLVPAETQEQKRCKYCHIQEDNDYDNFESYVAGFDSEDAGSIFPDLSSVVLPKKGILISLYFPAFDVPDFISISINNCPKCGRKMEVSE